MMKENKIQDERIVLTKRKIQSDGFQIVWCILIFSVLIQQYLYQAPFAQYAVEAFVLIGMSLYIVVANIVKGNDLFISKSRGKTIVIVNSLVAGGVVSIINVIMNYINYHDKIVGSLTIHLSIVALITFISATIMAFVVLQVFYLINNKKQQTIENELNNEN